MTNREKLASMSNDELAEFLGDDCVCVCCTRDAYWCKLMTCEHGIKEWLEQEYNKSLN